MNTIISVIRPKQPTEPGNIVGSLNGVGVAEYPSKGMVGLTSIFKDLAA